MLGPIARRIRTWTAALLAVAGAAAMQAGADTFYVNGSCGDDAWTGTSSVCTEPNGPKMTIQAGIDASVDGDTVIVADGTYRGVGNKNLDFGGRAISVLSENGPASCVIDCEGDGRGFHFHNGETAAAVLGGFTIRNGNVGFEAGGAILCESAGPTILSCVLTTNLAWQGGGLFSSSGHPSISNCTISENGALRGGGLMFRAGNATVADCAIVGNWLFGTASGGGMYTSARSDPTVTNCTFTSNTGGRFGGGMYNFVSSPTVTNCTFTSNSADRRGGGMYNTGGSHPTLINCAFDGNGGVYWGGGMYNTGNSSPTLTNCTFSENSAAGNGGGMYNAVLSTTTLTNCTFRANSAGFGGGMYNTGFGTTTLSNCTLSGNSAGSGGGMYNCGDRINPVVTNCILWNNRPDEIVNVGGAATTVRFSDVRGGWEGLGNIDADPLFVDPANGDLRLSPGSPCIDAADNTAVPKGIETDLDGNPRFVDDPATPDTGVPGGAGGDAIVDMGGYEFPCDPCDMNCDGQVNAFDVEPFLDLLFGGGEPCNSCTGDVSGDGNVDAFDIEPFLSCLFP